MLSGCMLRDKQLEDVRKILNSICDEFRENGDEFIFRFDFEPQDGTLGYGADWHPSFSQQKKMSLELTSFIESVTGWKKVK